MPTEKKVQLVDEMKERLARCTIAVATKYVGLPGNDMTDLRKRLRDRGIEFKVAKNTLTWIAAEQAGKPRVKEIVQGPTALAFGYADPIEVAKALDEYIRETRSILTISGAEMDGHILSPADVVALTRMPPKGVLVAQLLGQLQAPIANLVGVLNSPLAGLVNVLNGPLASLTNLLQGRARQLEGTAS